ncbi:hypothetical protein SAMD00019534_108930 [Acytostelium subglobosum LB1]|uniref:hypothetical protein n=1 Tax=Acytostelium subglobosum LB1 TaxID=1410327 RepID=UPI000644F0A8|nr:hypothetical protein SAMD00019534_108930 [Acytostelium subglobosum LB1]GAM27717.1 hypothetical protein SAMD00019534_108930 [Acytostelium subglobosum LB1]|eukprot:XP_012749376.1 hypothetical protein SAMD00019534_108930 [Acytostelium subglobosum LB1]
MSHARKHVTTNALNSSFMPEDDQSIVKIIDLRGGNIVEVQYPDGATVLAMIPTKFKGKLWIKLGNYAIVEREEETTSKVRTSIVHLISADNLKYMKKQGIWPSEFDDVVQKQTLVQEDNGDSDSDGGLDSMGFNPNHRGVQDDSDDSDDQDEE